jgi:glycosyltransferase involved in cell wall biosynthesis
MVRTVALTSRMLAVHSAGIAQDLRDEFPGVEVAAIPMGVADPLAGKRDAARDEVRARHGIGPDDLVFTAFGYVTPEKRIEQAIGALPAVARAAPTVRLLLVGAEASHYDARKDAEAAGVGDRIVFSGYVEDEALPDYMAATDVALCQRWPSAGETSASWLRCLGAGLPTVVTDLAHTVDVPTLDPRTWTLQHAPPGGERPAAAAIAVGIDILDEDHSLRIGMRRLATDATLREALGREARAWWEARHTIDVMTAAYRNVLDVACQQPEPAAAALPAHLRDERVADARALLAPFGIDVDVLR